MSASLRFRVATMVATFAGSAILTAGTAAPFSQGDGPQCAGTCVASVAYNTASPNVVGSATCGNGGFGVGIVVTPTSGLCNDGSGPCTSQCQFQVSVTYGAINNCVPLTLTGSECGTNISQTTINTSCPGGGCQTGHTASINRNCAAKCVVNYVLTNGPNSINVNATFTCSSSGTICQ